MKVIEARNVSFALAYGLDYLDTHGVYEESRNGPVLVSPGPVTTLYQKPWERWVLSPTRDANPFFHVMESLHMLAGRNDLAFLQQFNSKFGAYSDDGITQRGAYGHRWRKWFGYDQLHTIIAELRRDPTSRRCVLAMWDGGMTGYWYDQLESPPADDPSGDLLAVTVDKPCNLSVCFAIRHGRLTMTVYNRSNDILWGAYGANAVHFSYLQEYMAAMVGLPMGEYWQVSNNYHLYTRVLTPENRTRVIHECDTLGSLDLRHTALVTRPDTFDQELEAFMAHPEVGPEHWLASNIFFNGVAYPMYHIWQHRKTAARHEMEFLLNSITDQGWRLACAEWLERRNR